VYGPIVDRNGDPNPMDIINYAFGCFVLATPIWAVVVMLLAERFGGTE
jgi:hypothetical protein